MTPDLVERLRARAEHPMAFKVDAEVMHAAANRIQQLEAVLRMVKADRPTAHSDAVWQAINEALS